MPATTVSEKTFGPDVLGAAIPVLVEFTSAHSPSVPALEELAGALGGRMKVVRVDVDRCSTLKEDYAVRGLPALMLFKHGKPVARRVGNQLSKAELEEWIDGALVLALATLRSAPARSATEFKLANGLHVVAITDRRVPVVTHLVWYKVGPGSDPPDFTGLTRFVGHLSFKSLNKIAGGDFARAISRMGGESDALFQPDATAYWHRIPRDQLETVMRMEADRMAGLHLTDEEVVTERKVVLEAHRSSVDAEPTILLLKKMRAALFRAHTYNLPPGVLANEISRLSLADVLQFHQLHYAPSNAILVVAGDIAPDELRRLASETYGRVPVKPDFEPHAGGGANVNGAVRPTAHRVTLEDSLAETSRFQRRYAVPGYGGARPGEAEALDVLAKILIGGAASRLYRKLVIEAKVATSVSGGYFSSVRDGGELGLFAVANGGDLRAVEAAADHAIEDVRRHGVSQDELRCAKRSLVANLIYRSGDQLNLAFHHGREAALGRTVRDVEDWPAAISRVSVDDVRNVANEYVISRRSVTGWMSAKRTSTRARGTGRSSGQRSAL